MKDGYYPREELINKEEFNDYMICEICRNKFICSFFSENGCVFSGVNYCVKDNSLICDCCDCVNRVISKVGYCNIRKYFGYNPSRLHNQEVMIK